MRLKNAFPLSQTLFLIITVDQLLRIYCKGVKRSGRCCLCLSISSTAGCSRCLVREILFPPLNTPLSVKLNKCRSLHQFSLQISFSRKRDLQNRVVNAGLNNFPLYNADRPLKLNGANFLLSICCCLFFTRRCPTRRFDCQKTMETEIEQHEESFSNNETNGINISPCCLFCVKIFIEHKTFNKIIHKCCRRFVLFSSAAMFSYVQFKCYM